MSKPSKKSKAGNLVKLPPQPPAQTDFDVVLGLIEAARARAFLAVNTELVNLYWQVGEYISRKLESAAWGESVVEQLADHISRNHPDLKGFTRPNLFRMRQFYDAYRGDEKVSPLVRQLPWTHNLLILSRSKRPLALAKPTRLPRPAPARYTGRRPGRPKPRRAMPNQGRCLPRMSVIRPRQRVPLSADEGKGATPPSRAVAPLTSLEHRNASGGRSAAKKSATAPPSPRTIEERRSSRLSVTRQPLNASETANRID